MSHAQRIPAGLYAELEALRQLRDSVQEYAKRYMRDEIEDEDMCSPEQHELAAELGERLKAAYAVQWKGGAAVAAPFVVELPPAITAADAREAIGFEADDDWAVGAANMVNGAIEACGSFIKAAGGTVK